MTVEELKTAVKDMSVFLEGCHDESDTITFGAKIIKSIKESFEELIEFKNKADFVKVARRKYCIHNEYRNRYMLIQGDKGELAHCRAVNAHRERGRGAMTTKDIITIQRSLGIIEGAACQLPQLAQSLVYGAVEVITGIIDLEQGEVTNENKTS